MKKKLLIIIGIILVFIVVLCIAVPKIQKQQKKERLEATYRSKIEESIEAFKPEHINAIKNKYGEEYANISFDIRYTLIVYDSGKINVCYFIEGDEILKEYSSYCQKQACKGFFSLYSELGTYSISGTVHINDTLCVDFNDFIEHVEESQETRKRTCNVYDCYEYGSRPSGYCTFHDNILGD